jgi:phosphate transporter
MQLEMVALKQHAALKHGCNEAASRTELSQRLDDIISFNRASVWREQAGYERGRAHISVATHGELAPQAWLDTRIGTATILAFAVIIFLTIMHLKTMDTPAQQRCLAMAVLLSILWCTEVIPLYVTSMLVPALTVLLKILPDPSHNDRQLAAPDAAKHVFSVCPYFLT